MCAIRMRKYDFILVYEHKVRELETLCLLKCELERRNYKVLILGLNSFEFYKSHNSICNYKYYARVLGVFGCYNTNTLRMCVQQHILFDKVIDLQWEQMISKRQEKAGSMRNFTEIGKHVVHISWGDANRKRLIEVAGIDKNKVFKCGNMAFDFLTPKFDSYYNSANRIHEIYNIPSHMKICTIFANFRGADMGEEQVEQRRKKMGDGWVAVQKIGKRVKGMLLEWIVRAADDYPDIFFVYRPHPGENTTEVEHLLGKYENIRIIGDLSSKQWIKISDYMFTWHSTVAIEARMANRQCVLIEPEDCHVPPEEDSVIFENVIGISNYKEFSECLAGKIFENSISDKLIEEYFGSNYIENSYKKVVDVFEKVLVDDYFLLTNQIKKYGIYELPSNARKRIGIYWVLDEIVFKYLAMCVRFGINCDKESVKEYQMIRNKEKRECASNREIRRICNKINKII